MNTTINDPGPPGDLNMDLSSIDAMLANLGAEQQRDLELQLEADRDLARRGLAIKPTADDEQGLTTSADVEAEQFIPPFDDLDDLTETIAKQASLRRGHEGPAIGPGGWERDAYSKKLCTKTSASADNESGPAEEHVVSYHSRFTRYNEQTHMVESIDVDLLNEDTATPGVVRLILNKGQPRRPNDASGTVEFEVHHVTRCINMFTLADRLLDQAAGKSVAGTVFHRSEEKAKEKEAKVAYAGVLNNAAEDQIEMAVDDGSAAEDGAANGESATYPRDIPDEERVHAAMSDELRGCKQQRQGQAGTIEHDRMTRGDATIYRTGAVITEIYTPDGFTDGMGTGKTLSPDRLKQMEKLRTDLLGMEFSRTLEGDKQYVCVSTKHGLVILESDSSVQSEASPTQRRWRVTEMFKCVVHPCCDDEYPTESRDYNEMVALQKMLSESDDCGIYSKNAYRLQRAVGHDEDAPNAHSVLMPEFARQRLENDLRRIYRSRGRDYCTAANIGEEERIEREELEEVFEAVKAEMETPEPYVDQFREANPKDIEHYLRKLRQECVQIAEQDEKVSDPSKGGTFEMTSSDGTNYTLRPKRTQTGWTVSIETTCGPRRQDIPLAGLLQRELQSRQLGGTLDTVAGALMARLRLHARVAEEWKELSSYSKVPRRIKETSMQPMPVSPSGDPTYHGSQNNARSPDAPLPGSAIRKMPQSPIGIQLAAIKRRRKAADDSEAMDAVMGMNEADKKLFRKFGYTSGKKIVVSKDGPNKGRVGTVLCHKERMKSKYPDQPTDKAEYKLRIQPDDQKEQPFEVSARMGHAMAVNPNHLWEGWSFRAHKMGGQDFAGRTSQNPEQMFSYSAPEPAVQKILNHEKRWKVFQPSGQIRLMQIGDRTIPLLKIGSLVSQVRTPAGDHRVHFVPPPRSWLQLKFL